MLNQAFSPKNENVGKMTLPPVFSTGVVRSLSGTNSKDAQFTLSEQLDNCLFVLCTCKYKDLNTKTLLKYNE